ncbi:MAG: alpha/beta fold hydrolase [Gordonia sp. (in: high G+C Gram-positive bacteria)]|uniref:alpha/beta hydrolase family protein n=1 Tax=Gordonia sp. (in: high G+C Gram-positive bacteria) TaxID=84139 RepID=UPI003C72FCFB
MARYSSPRALAAAITAMAVVSACSTSPDMAPAAPSSEQVATFSETQRNRIHYLTGTDQDPDQNWADFYLPAGRQAVDTIPLVVLIHGGGWRSQIGANVFDELAMDLAGRGMAVYNVEYRRLGRGGGWPTTFRDVARALDHIIDLDKKFPQITVRDELVVGHSAGGQLAMWAGTRHKLEDDEVGSRPRFRPTRVVSLAGPLDMRQTAKDGNNHIIGAMGAPPSAKPERWDAVDPIKNIDPTMPVAAVHGTADTVVRPHNSTRYIAEVERRGGAGRLLLLDGEGHVSLVQKGSPAYTRVIDLIAEYSSEEQSELTEE